MLNRRKIAGWSKQTEKSARSTTVQRELRRAGFACAKDDQHHRTYIAAAEITKQDATKNLKVVPALTKKQCPVRGAVVVWCAPRTSNPCSRTPV